MKGWVYVITNSAMPGLVKVGFTMKDPAMRAAELSNTGVPQPYKVEYEVLIDDPAAIEREAHLNLKDSSAGKEWFRCSIASAASAIKIAVGDSRVYSESKMEQDIYVDNCMSEMYKVLDEWRDQISQESRSGDSQIESFLGHYLEIPAKYDEQSDWRSRVNQDHYFFVTTENSVNCIYRCSPKDVSMKWLKAIEGMSLPVSYAVKTGDRIQGLRLDDLILYWEPEFSENQLDILRKYFSNQYIGNLKVEKSRSSYFCEETKAKVAIAKVEYVDRAARKIYLVLATSSVKPLIEVPNILGYKDVPNRKNIYTWDTAICRFDEQIPINNSELIWPGCIVEYKEYANKKSFRILFEMPEIFQSSTEVTSIGVTISKLTSRSSRYLTKDH